MIVIKQLVPVLLVYRKNLYRHCIDLILWGWAVVMCEMLCAVLDLASVGIQHLSPDHTTRQS